VIGTYFLLYHFIFSRCFEN